MTKHLATTSKSAVPLPADYALLLADIKARVQSARIKAGLAANRQLLALYWDIGRLILSRQRQEGWGTKVIDRLSLDLQRAFPGQQGSSPRNLKYMRAFAAAWPETIIVQQPAAQIAKSGKADPAMVQQPVAPLAKTKQLKPLIVPEPLAQTAAAIVHQPRAQLSWVAPSDCSGQRPPSFSQRCAPLNPALRGRAVMVGWRGRYRIDRAKTLKCHD